MSICTFCHPSSTSFSASTRRYANSASTGFHTRARCGPSTTKESTTSTRKFTALALATLLLAGCGSSSLRNERDDLNVEFKDTKTALEEAKAEQAQQRANAAETKQVLMGLDTEIPSADVTAAGKNRAVAPVTTPPTGNSASGSSMARWFKTSRLARTRTHGDRFEVYTDVDAPKSVKVQPQHVQQGHYSQVRAPIEHCFDIGAHPSPFSTRLVASDTRLASRLGVPGAAYGTPQRYRHCT